MASVWEQRWSDFVRTVTSLRESTELELLPDLMPVLLVNDPVAPELARARGERLITASISGTAAAAQFATLWVENRAATNVLVVLRNIIIVSSVGQVVGMRSVASAAPGAPTTVQSDDDRDPGVSMATRMVFESAVASFVTATSRTFAIQGSVLTQVPIQQVIAPGFSFQVQLQTANSDLRIMVQGYERVVTAREFR